ncbi:hypothetical protein GEMRC1_000618 [Eukaryota sp. GEM-RC1]
MNKRFVFSQDEEFIKRYIVTKSAGFSYPDYMIKTPQFDLYQEFFSTNLKHDKMLEVVKVLSEIMTDHTSPSYELTIGKYPFDEQALTNNCLTAALLFMPSISNSKLMLELGDGGDGKTIRQNASRLMMGDYGINGDASVLTTNTGGGANAHDGKLLQLINGVRAVYASEPPAPFKEDLIKANTDNGISRQLRGLKRDGEECRLDVNFSLD